ncbi:CBS domain protein [compost metagenome]
MSSKVISIEESATVDEAAERMAAEQIRRLPVTRGGKLIGVVSLGDLAVKRIFADEAGEALSEISQRKLH